MKINGESIYGTRVWKCFGEGPLTETANGMTGQGFNANYQLSDQAYMFISKEQMMDFPKKLRATTTSRVLG